MKKTFYKWVVLKDGEVVRCGIEDRYCEIFVDHIFPDLNSSVDRDLSQMQGYADKYLFDHKYFFNFIAIKVDFSDLVN